MSLLRSLCASQASSCALPSCVRSSDRMPGDEAACRTIAPNDPRVGSKGSLELRATSYAPVADAAAIPRSLLHADAHRREDSCTKCGSDSSRSEAAMVAVVRSAPESARRGPSPARASLSSLNAAVLSSPDGVQALRTASLGEGMPRLRPAHSSLRPWARASPPRPSSAGRATGRAEAGRRGLDG